ncbi:hypothetical protein QYF61_000169, partial [Mycteria americana]
MLAGLDLLVILYMPCDGTQDDLLHQLPRYQESAKLEATTEKEAFPRHKEPAFILLYQPFQLQRLGSPFFRRRQGYIGVRPAEATKLVRVLEHRTCKECLRATVKQWERLLGEGVKSPSLQIFKTQLDIAMSK